MTLPTQTQIVVIGGGIIGCSTAYHLARDHKARVVVLEQGRVTSGTTWHAAGLVGQLRSSASITRVLKYSVELYQNLKSETGLDTGWKMTGCLRLATTKDRWIEYKRLATTARSFGMDMELLSPSEVKRMWPLMDTSDLIGASWLATDGQASPSDVTQALAKGARMHGVKFHEGVRVTGFDLKGSRITAVKTNQGTIRCDKVVNCAGMWARDVGAMAGVNVPLQPVKHQYVITDKISGLATDAPTLRDPDRRTYFKEEVGGLVMGGYEPDPIAWTTAAVPADWEFKLFDDDFDHFEQHMEQAVARVPVLSETGIKKMINGPESFTPDGNFILGRSHACENMFVGAGFNAFGIAAAGGAGWVLADWVMKGEAPLDLWVVDIQRFSQLHEDREWVKNRTLEAYGKHYTVAYPHEEYESGRPHMVSPLYERLAAQGAVFGSKLGWERPNWFARRKDIARDEYAMGRQNWFEAVGEEHRHVREHVGVFDQTSFAKFELRGADAAEALEWICANRVARDVGRLTYTQLLNSRGGIEADLTVSRLSEDRFYIVTGTGFRAHDFGWIRQHLPHGKDIALDDVTEEMATLSVMGPNARLVLQQSTHTDMSAETFRFGEVRPIEIAGHVLWALRVTYVGELGYELHMPIDVLEDVYDCLMKQGSSKDIRPVGYRALESLRLEKAYRAWGADITPNDTPFEAGLGWAVKLRSGQPFLGREALEKTAASPLKKSFVGFALEGDDVLVGRETILRDGEPVGYLTSAGYGHTIKAPIGFGYVRNPSGIEVEWLLSGRYALVVAGEVRSARLSLEPFVDPSNLKVKA